MARQSQLQQVGFIGLVAADFAAQGAFAEEIAARDPELAARLSTEAERLSVDPSGFIADTMRRFMGAEDGANLLAGYKRAANILKKEGFAAAEGAQALSYTPEPAEKALIDALDAAAPRAAQAVEAERFADAMAALATLRAPIDRFFEEVTVNDPEADKRSARLALLARFRDAVHRVADFSRIEG